jgi:hypothetical protein
MRRILLLIAACVAIAGPAGAKFGAKGQLVPAGGVAFSAAFPTPGESGSSSYSVSVSPNLLYFVADRWAFGGSIGIGYFTSDGTHQLSLSLGPTAGYAVPVSERLSLFPQLTLFGGRISGTTQVVVPGNVFAVEQTNWFLSAFAFVPVLFHPAEHVLLGFGPNVQVDVAASSALAQRIRLGLSSTIGVYF